jgi:hypothetical protein
MTWRSASTEQGGYQRWPAGSAGCMAAPALAHARPRDSAGGEPLVLIDGYRRVAALRRLGRDTASVRSAESKPGQRELTVRAPVSAATDRSVTIDFQRPPG